MRLITNINHHNHGTNHQHLLIGHHLHHHPEKCKCLTVSTTTSLFHWWYHVVMTTLIKKGRSLCKLLYWKAQHCFRVLLITAFKKHKSLIQNFLLDIFLAFLICFNNVPMPNFNLLILPWMFFRFMSYSLLLAVCEWSIRRNDSRLFLYFGCNGCSYRGYYSTFFQLFVSGVIGVTKVVVIFYFSCTWVELLGRLW